MRMHPKAFTTQMSSLCSGVLKLLNLLSFSGHFLSSAYLLNKLPVLLLEKGVHSISHVGTQESETSHPSLFCACCDKTLI